MPSVRPIERIRLPPMTFTHSGGTMQPSHLALLAAAAFAGASLACREDATGPAAPGGPSLAAEASTQQFVNHLAVTRFVPCANGGVGEDVSLSGDIHVVFHVTLDGSGGAHVDEIHNPQGVKGTGLITGATYQGVGGSPLDASNVRVGEEHSSVRNMLIIGQGPGNNFMLHENFHITVLADGTVTSVHDNFTSECR
jgi:hypothetical protein